MTQVYRIQRTVPYINLSASMVRQRQVILNLDLNGENTKIGRE